MAKALKTIAIVAGVAALVVVTGGAAAGLGVSLGTTLIGTGISAGALLAGSALASTAAGLLAKGPKVPTSQTDRLTASIDPRTFRKTVLGSTAFPVDVRYEEWSGNDQEYCDWIVAHASHAVDGLDEIWLNTDLAWTAAGGVTPKFAGYFSVPNIILEGSPANAFRFASGKWNGSARLTGCAYSRLRFKVTGNGKKATSPFSSGIPNRITIIGRGAKLYDPRRDSTVPGGSGPMRHDDQSTWRYTADDGAVIGENLPLHALRIVLGWRIRNPVSGQMKLATGSGVPGRRLNLASWIVSANLADEAVNRSAGGTEPRYHGAGVVSEGDDPQTPLDAICAACCGRFRDTGGKLSFSISHNDLAAAATDDGLNDDDVIGPFTWDPDPSLAGTPNVVRGRYVDATSSSLYQLIDYPEVRLPSPDGQDRIFPLDLGYVESPSHAQRVAKQVLQRKQYQREFTAPFDIRAWKYSVGDVVPFTFATLSFNRKLFRVKEQELGQGGICNMTLTVEHAQIYAFDKDDAAPVVAAEPNVYDATKNPLILAIEDASTTADWEGVTGVAKPADNATNSADPNSPFGPGGTVGDAQRAIDAAKARQDTLENVTIPAVDKAVKDAGDRITTARERADKALADLVAEIGRAQGVEGQLKERIDSIVAEGGYDDTALYAAVDRVDRAAVGRDVAIGERIETVKASVDTVDTRIAATATEITRAYTDADRALGSRTGTLEAQMNLTSPSELGRILGVVDGRVTDVRDAANARIKNSEDVLADLPNRYAAASTVRTLDAQLRGAEPSGISTSLIARIEDRATAIADAKSGVVAETVSTLRGEYNGTKTEVSDQRGVINGLNGKTAAYVRILTDAGNGRAALSLWSDQYGGAWSLTGDGLIDGNLTINGTVTARKFNRFDMSRLATASWTGSITPTGGTRVLVPWRLELPSIPPLGRFIYEFSAQVTSNVGQRDALTRNGKPYYINYVEAGGGLEVICLDPQGNGYRPRPNSSDPVVASADFVPLFQASIGNGNFDTGIIDEGDYYSRQVAATYTVTSINLRLTWVAI